MHCCPGTAAARAVTTAQPGTVSRAVVQVPIPVAGSLKEQLEELGLERSKKGSVQSGDEYRHLYQAVPAEGCL